VWFRSNIDEYKFVLSIGKSYCRVIYCEGYKTKNLNMNWNWMGDVEKLFSLEPSNITTRGITRRDRPDLGFKLFSQDWNILDDSSDIT
jgi:hypothetical protein